MEFFDLWQLQKISESTDESTDPLEELISFPIDVDESCRNCGAKTLRATKPIRSRNIPDIIYGEGHCDSCDEISHSTIIFNKSTQTWLSSSKWDQVERWKELNKAIE